MRNIIFPPCLVDKQEILIAIHFTFQSKKQKSNPHCFQYRGADIQKCSQTWDQSIGIATHREHNVLDTRSPNSNLYLPWKSQYCIYLEDTSGMKEWSLYSGQWRLVVWIISGSGPDSLLLLRCKQALTILWFLPLLLSKIHFLSLYTATAKCFLPPKVMVISPSAEPISSPNTIFLQCTGR